tara:strand:+ start:224 stop:406 length:183 start_codon:yes stop_codon:yes gene_type:complete
MSISVSIGFFFKLLLYDLATKIEGSVRHTIGITIMAMGSNIIVASGVFDADPGCIPTLRG